MFGDAGGSRAAAGRALPSTDFRHPFPHRHVRISPPCSVPLRRIRLCRPCGGAASFPDEGAKLLVATFPTVMVLARTAAAQPPPDEPNLLLISVFAFLAVFLVLLVLAGIMRALTHFFPPPDDGPDAALLAAISAAASAAWPGLRVTRIEEQR
jgi:hypothetical protein